MLAKRKERSEDLWGGGSFPRRGVFLFIRKCDVGKKVKILTGGEAVRGEKKEDVGERSQVAKRSRLSRAKKKGVWGKLKLRKQKTMKKKSFPVRRENL